MATEIEVLKRQLTAAQREIDGLRTALDPSTPVAGAGSPRPSQSPRAPGSPSKSAAGVRLGLGRELGVLYTKFVESAHSAGEQSMPPLFTALDAALQRLQDVCGARTVGCHGPLPHLPDPDGPEDDADDDKECTHLLVTRKDVTILTTLLSQLASNKRIHRASSGRMLKQSLEKEFSSHSEVFDQATREYVLGVTETRKQTPLERLRAVGRRIRARQMRKGRGSIKNLLEGLSLTNKANLQALQFVQGINRWNYNIFTARDQIAAALGRKEDEARPKAIPGTLDTFGAVGMNAFTRLGCVVPLGIDPKVLRAYVLAIGGKYNDVPYHNALHAADVAQSVFFFLDEGNLADSLTIPQQFACIWAALAHDLGHSALTNPFLVRTGHSLALRYNDKSVLENFHAATAFETATHVGNDFLSPVPHSTRTELRSLVIDMILATDNAVHGHVMARFSERIEAQEEQPINMRTSNKDASVVLSVMLHCADVSNPAKEWSMYRRWTSLIIEEFYAQGDKEKELGLPVMAINDRDAGVPLANMQAGFIRGLVLPLYTSFARLSLVDLSTPCTQLNANLKVWEDEIHSRTAAASGAGAGAGAGAGTASAAPTRNGAASPPPAPPASAPPADAEDAPVPPPPPSE